MPGGIGPNPLPIPGTREFDLSAVGPGWGVYFAQHPLSELPDRGGTCLEVIHSQWADAETGELVTSTRFKVFTHRVVAPFDVIDSARVDVERAQFELVSATAALYGVLKLIVARRKQPRTMPASDQELMADAIRLFRAITGPSR